MGTILTLAALAALVGLALCVRLFLREPRKYPADDHADALDLVGFFQLPAETLQLPCVSDTGALAAPDAAGAPIVSDIVSRKLGKFGLFHNTGDKA